MIISPDNFIYNAEGIYEWTPAKAKSSWNKAYGVLRKAIRSGKYDKVIMMGGIPASGKTTYLSEVGREPNAIYFDATFTNKWGRGMMIELINEEDPDMWVEIIFLDTPKNVCLMRNEERSPDRKIPTEAYDRMCGALEKEGFPTKAEGFDKVTIIR